jgi:aminodeoxyfutalosine synthase
MLAQIIESSGLADIHEKVVAGHRLGVEEGVRLYRSPHLTVVGHLANIVRERKNGDRAYYIRNLHVNYTNVCNKLCKFCSFYAPPGDERGYVLSPSQVQERLRPFRSARLSEVHVVGGIHPKLPYSYYIDLLRAIKEERPDVHVKAFTMIELAQVARVARKPLSEVMPELREAGLDSCPGGGAEVFSDRVHEELFRAKLDNEGWFDVARAVHTAGLRSNATMLYGHIETVEEKARHLVHIRELQDETGGFLCFIPLAFDPQRTELSHLSATTGEQNLREIAVARLMLDSFDHIKAFWIMITPAIAQLALWYGADDIDGTVSHYEITHALGSASDTQHQDEDELVHLIRMARRRPVERNTLYGEINPVAPTSPAPAPPAVVRAS